MHVALFRITFGLIWATDAAFKWSSTFRQGFLDQIVSAGQGQPNWLQGWFHFWNSALGHNPQLFATLVAIVETLIALALILGVARRSTYLVAIVFCLLIWGVAEGFGGPYTLSSTDIGTAVIYALVFFALYGLERFSVSPSLSVDNYIIKKLPWWSVIANP